MTETVSFCKVKTWMWRHELPHTHTNPTQVNIANCFISQYFWHQSSYLFLYLITLNSFSAVFQDVIKWL